MSQNEPKPYKSWALMAAEEEEEDERDRLLLEEEKRLSLMRLVTLRRYLHSIGRYELEEGEILG